MVRHSALRMRAAAREFLVLIRKCAYILSPVFGRVDIDPRGACWRAELQNIFGEMPTMKKTHHETVVRKRIMLGAVLTLLLGLPLAFSNRAFANPTPKFVYVVNFCVSRRDCSAGNVSAYTINSATGALREIAGSPFAAGSDPQSVTVDPSGRFAYVANFFGNNVSAYTINRSTGALRAVAGSLFAAAL